MATPSSHEPEFEPTPTDPHAPAQPPPSSGPPHPRRQRSHALLNQAQVRVKRFWNEPSTTIDVNFQKLTAQQLGVLTGITVVVVLASLVWQVPWLGLPASILALILSLRVLWSPLQVFWSTSFPSPYRQWVLATLVGSIAIAGLAYSLGITHLIWLVGRRINWEAFGALADAFGALGQILVAFLALFVAWRQYVISKDLTTQQNRITQQQTIDAYFQGISDLVLDERGLLEDWPPERAIAEGRTAAILGGLNGEGKAKILRFLSSAKLLTPLKRDRRLGRPIFDGLGSYEEDVEYGVRVIDLGSMLAHAELSATDLHRTELSDANLAEANLQGCDLSRANLCRCILYGANLQQADLGRTRLFYGAVDTATPRDRIHPPNYETGDRTGAIVEDADFSQVRGLSDEQRAYLCAWGGPTTRATIPGGCQDISSRLEA